MRPQHKHAPRHYHLPAMARNGPREASKPGRVVSASEALREIPIQATQATIAARRYFLDNRTHKEIGVELGISRFKVARLIEWARSVGLVRIEIVELSNNDAELGAQVSSAFGLRGALVVSGLDGPSDVIAGRLADLAAFVVSELVSANDVLGISWGRTLDHLVDRLGAIRAKTVVQVVGGLESLESAAGGIDLVRRLAAKAGTTGYPLLAPVRLPDRRLAERLRAGSAVAETLNLIEDVTVLLAGIGSWGEPPASRMTECFSEKELKRLRSTGVVADMCGFLFSSDGKFVALLEDERIGITRSQLDAAGTVLAVAGGTEKHEAIAAVLQSKLVDIIVTDAGSAHYLLSTVRGQQPPVGDAVPTPSPGKTVRLP